MRKITPKPNGAPLWTARAPGRVNIIGEHIDYNDGWVLPMAIEQAVTINAWPLTEPIVTIHSTLNGECIQLDLGAPERQATPSWGNYVQGVLWEFIRETGATPVGFHATIDSKVPQGAGLSSSAALEVATATLLEKITGHTLGGLKKARLCQRVEHDYVGMPCGLMDQAASALCREGHLLLLDCVTNDFRHIPFSDENVVVLITNTGVTHALADGEYAQRRGQAEAALATLGKSSYRDVTLAELSAPTCTLDDIPLRRARHVVGEIARTLATVDALERDDWDAVGELLYASHESLSRDYEVSCPELDCLVEATRKCDGVVGARMTGGGFGGCTITLVHAAQVDALKAHLSTQYRKNFGAKPEFYTARPSRGAD